MAFRQEVLNCFRKLHKTRKCTFAGDEFALGEMRLRINGEFKKHMSEDNPDKIRELIKLALDVEQLVKTSVIQAKLNDRSGNYELNIHKDINKFTNMPYKK